MRRLLVVPAVLALTLTACSTDETASASNAISVTSTDTACETGKTSIAAGTAVINVTNDGSKTTELYVYGENDRIITERENIGPGTSAELTVEMPEGAFQIACKPGQVGDGIRQPLTVTAATSTPTANVNAEQATKEYRTWVLAQVNSSLLTTEQFVDAVKAGDVAKAKTLFAPSRYGWEAVEPVAESFGDLDPKLDLREADLEPGQTWTGWHRIEKSLWVNNSTAGMAPIADQLLVDLKTLETRVPEAPITATSMANGAKELLDEVATGKITGEEDIFSHTDLTDFAANVEGAQKIFTLLKPVATPNDPALVEQLGGAFTRVNDLLAKYKTGTVYLSYDKVTETQRKELSDAVNALAEPLSHLAAAVVQK